MTESNQRLDLQTELQQLESQLREGSLQSAGLRAQITEMQEMLAVQRLAMNATRAQIREVERRLDLPNTESDVPEFLNQVNALLEFLERNKGMEVELMSSFLLDYQSTKDVFKSIAFAACEWDVI